jgi:hypothetical protein
MAAYGRVNAAIIFGGKLIGDDTTHRILESKDRGAGVKRKCLRCDAEFVSTGCGNRVCERCWNLNRHMTDEDVIHREVKSS